MFTTPSVTKTKVNRLSTRYASSTAVVFRTPSVTQDQGAFGYEVQLFCCLIPFEMILLFECMPPQSEFSVTRTIQINLLYMIERIYDWF